jgi:hypothetical protein
MQGENMLKKKALDEAAAATALQRSPRRELYFEQIAVLRH